MHTPLAAATPTTPTTPTTTEAATAADGGDALQTTTVATTMVETKTAAISLGAIPLLKASATSSAATKAISSTLVPTEACSEAPTQYLNASNPALQIFIRGKNKLNINIYLYIYVYV